MSDHHSHGAHGDDGTMGVHGMVLLAGEVLYLSHLPMFARPHNFQVLLEVGLDDAVREMLGADRHLAGDGLYTFVPTPFQLSELAPGGDGPARTSMEGSLVHGHFERGGKPIAQEVAVEILRVVYFGELDSDAGRPDDGELTYLCFGRAGRLYLAHELTARPDFDHLLSARLVAGTGTNQGGRRLPEEVAKRGFELAQRVRFPGRSDTPTDRLAPREVVQGLFDQTIAPGGFHGFKIQVEVGRELYFEAGELA